MVPWEAIWYPGGTTLVGGSLYLPVYMPAQQLRVGHTYYGCLQVQLSEWHGLLKYRVKSEQ